MSKVSIIGAYNTEFGFFAKIDKETKARTDLKSYYDLIIEAGKGAIADAGISAKDIDAVWMGACSPAGFVNQEHAAPIATLIDPGLLYKPMTRTENACASSTTAFYSALYAVESGRYDTVLVLGAEKMSMVDTKQMTHVLACSSFYPEEGGKGMSFPALFAEYAKGYKEHYKISPQDLRKAFAYVAALGYKNGSKNPIAQQKNGPMSAEEILGMPDEGKGSNPLIAEPLRLHDCSLVSDGAAAIIITRTDKAKQMKDKVVEIAGIGHTTEIMPISKRQNMYDLIAAKKAAALAYKEAGITAKDLNFVEVHDCFTINQVLATEALGLAKDGQAWKDYIDGKFTVDDVCAVNLSGGLKSKGHPVGATGVSMHAHVYKNLMGQPYGVAAKKQEIGGVYNVGGSGVSNCVTVLKRIK